MRYPLCLASANSLALSTSSFPPPFFFPNISANLLDASSLRALVLQAGEAELLQDGQLHYPLGALVAPVSAECGEDMLMSGTTPAAGREAGSCSVVNTRYLLDCNERIPVKAVKADELNRHSRHRYHQQQQQQYPSGRGVRLWWRNSSQRILSPGSSSSAAAAGVAPGSSSTAAAAGVAPGSSSSSTYSFTSLASKDRREMNSWRASEEIRVLSMMALNLKDFSSVISTSADLLFTFLSSLLFPVFGIEAASVA
jgi:hypothetical protein